jgi:hypothetical protein
MSTSSPSSLGSVGQRNAEQLGEVRNLAQGIDAGGAGFRRDQADGGGTAKEVPDQRLRADNFDRGRDERIFSQQVAELVGDLRREAVKIAVEREEAVGEADVAHALEGGLRSAEWRDQQTHFHGFERGGRRRGK